MNKTDIVAEIQQIFAACSGNILTEETAVSPELVGLPLFEAPLVGIGSAEDELFEVFLAPEVIGPWHMAPTEWLSGAKTVISLFLPFTEPIRLSNRIERTTPSVPWLQGRIEGQNFINAFIHQVRDWLKTQCVDACVPSQDSRFFASEGNGGVVGHPEFPLNGFGSNWSERHVAYVCGLGTFGLSKGFITVKGMAGRFCSVITNLPVEADQRDYTGVYDYCSMCGSCVRRCAVQAISLEAGKEHTLCKEQLDRSRRAFAPRYGCGLCQTGVPCEDKIPSHLKTNA